MRLLDRPFPLRVHPDAQAIEQRYGAWCARYEVRRYQQQRCGWLAAAACPDGDPQIVELAAATLLWVFVIDDYVDSSPPAERPRQPLTLLRTIRITQDPEFAVNERQPVETLMRAITDRLRALATPTQYHRYSHQIAEWLMGMWCTQTTPLELRLTVDEYRLMRHFASGLPIMFSLIDLAAGVQLPDEAWRDRAVARATDLASMIICLCNDVRSAPKEAEHDSNPHNLASLHAREHSLTLPEGITYAAAYTNALIREFAEHVLALRPHVDPVVACYLTGLTGWVTAHDEWSGWITDRYPGAPT